MSEQMRKEFEAWGAKESYEVGHKGVDGRYLGPATAIAWEAWQAALATQPQAPQGAVPTVTVSRSLALKTWGFLAQDCSPCAHPECQIDGKNIGVESLHADWNAAILAAPETPEGAKP